MKRICIVTSEAFGPHKNGGIGTSQTFLAILLAANSFSVDMLYTGDVIYRDLAHWSQWYSKFNVNFTGLRISDRKIFPSVAAKSHEIYRTLKGTRYDLIVFQDWGGDGYATTCAKRSGMFPHTKMAVWLHSPELWLRFANRVPLTNADDLWQMEMERISVEQSDFILSPSQYMIEWLDNNGWNISGKAQHLPLYIPDIVLDEALPQITENGASALASKRIIKKSRLDTSHLVFFGRLELRKGIEEFAKIVNLSHAEANIRRVTLVGKTASHTLADFKALLNSNVEVVLDHKDGFNSSEALSWLTQQNPIVVLPSLVDNSPCVIYECLNRGLTFITTDNGGMRELIDPRDWAHSVAVVRASEIAKLVIDLCRTRHSAPRAAMDAGDISKRTVDLFEQMAGQSAVLCEPKLTLTPRDVTIVITHYERPHLLAGLLETLTAQTASGFNVIIVDDCSQSLSAKQTLTEIERLELGFPLKILRKSANQYLGAARNSGLALVETDYVIFIDDDNLPMDDMVEKFISVMNYSGADIVACAMVAFDDATGLRRTDKDSYPHWSFIPKSLALAPVRNVFGDATSLYRCDAIRKVGGFHEIYGTTHEDWELHLRLAANGYSHEYLPETTFWYRSSANSMIRTTNQYLNDERQIEAFSSLLPGSAKAVSRLLVGIERHVKSLENENRALEAKIKALRTRHDTAENSARIHLRHIAKLLDQNGRGRYLPAAIRKILAIASSKEY